MNSRDDNYYDSRLQDIKLEEITSSQRNIHVLEKFRRGDPDLTYLCVDVRWEDNDSDDDIDDDEITYTADCEEGDDLGWLGYFIGRSEHLKTLYISDLPFTSADPHTEQLHAFTREMSRNRSIVDLTIQHDIKEIGFRNICSFVGENNNLRRLELHHMKPGNESVKHFALMLEQRRCNSLQKLSFADNEFEDAEIEVIAKALREQASLEKLEFRENNYLDPAGCAALGTTLSTWKASKLKILNFWSACIDDAGLGGLVAGLVHCTKLEDLILSYNSSITAVGLRSLAALFQSEHCCLKRFRIDGVYFGDDGAIALADALVGNASLELMSLYIRPDYATDDNTFITEVGWSAFSKRFLCDTSSVTNTYLSNHTLGRVESDDRGIPPPCVGDYLDLNRCNHETIGGLGPYFAFFENALKFDGVNVVAVIKILTHHTDLEVESLFKWDLKCLPKLVEWFQMVNEDVVANLIEVRRQFEEYEAEAQRHGYMAKPFPRYANMVIEKSEALEFDNMKLSSIFKFVRAMPKLVVNSIRGKGKDESRKRKASD